MSKRQMILGALDTRLQRSDSKQSQGKHSPDGFCKTGFVLSTVSQTSRRGSSLPTMERKYSLLMIHTHVVISSRQTCLSLRSSSPSASSSSSSSIVIIIIYHHHDE
eukprot:8549777-Karenia_brevis.AAC.1